MKPLKLKKIKGYNKIMLSVDTVKGGQEISVTFHNNYKYTFDELETSSYTFFDYQSLINKNWETNAILLQ